MSKSKFIFILTFPLVLISCDSLNTPIGAEEEEVCDCTTIQEDNLSGEWKRTPYSKDVKGNYCALDGDTSYHLQNYRTITICEPKKATRESGSKLKDTI